MNNADIVKLAVDSYKGSVEKYSVGQAQDVLRQALIEANNGQTSLNYKDIRDGKCGALFTIIEEILSATVAEGLQGDEFFMSLVDFRNLALGDTNEFVVQDSNLFVIAEAADGTQGIRRQRLGDRTVKSIPTTLKVVRIYEELNRVLAGRVDFNYFIGRVAESFRRKILDDIYALWSNVSQAELGGAVFNVSGSYSETDLLTLIAHVEAAAGGKPATIIGTKTALRNLAPSIQSDGYKEDLYNLGYCGKFYGTPVVATPQRHKIGSTEFVLDDTMITIVAGDDKPIKFVYEGDPLVIMGDPLDNADLTVEYFYAQKTGIGIVLAGNRNCGIGRYTIET